MYYVILDISGQESKSITAFDGRSFDFVITVCRENECPLFVGRADKRLAWALEDPAAASGTEEEILEIFREVRDKIEVEIRDFIERYG